MAPRSETPVMWAAFAGGAGSTPLAHLFVVEPVAWLSYFHFSGQGLGLDSTAVLGYGLEVIVGPCAVLFVGRHFGVWRRANRFP